jgi:hypothetical protein
MTWIQDPVSGAILSADTEFMDQKLREISIAPMKKERIYIRWRVKDYE